MRKYRMRKILMIGLVFLLCGCQANPDKDVVTSKNNGILQDKIYATDSSDTPQDARASKIDWEEEFTSTDGSVRFCVNLDDEVSLDVRQVVEVVPHIITDEERCHVAHVLLGDVDFYERRESANPVYSKSQLRQMINRLSAYATKESLTELMGLTHAETYLEYVQLFINSWTGEYETAPEADRRMPCDWKLKKERVYNTHPMEIGDRPIDRDRDILIANAQKDGIEYNYYADGTVDYDIKINAISLQLSEGIGLMPVDMAIYRAMLCRTEKPSEEQIAAVVQKAQEILQEINLGQWEIVTTKLETYADGAEPEYVISLTAQPVIHGVSSIVGQAAESPEDAFAPAYQMTAATMWFSANGDFLYFYVTSPVDVLEVPNENVATIPVEELVEKCKQQLSLSDRDTYGLPDYFCEATEDYIGENILCQVKITEAECGFGRIKVPNTDDNYYYVPVLAFRGISTYVSDQSGTVYYDNTPLDSDEKPPILVCINAIDGTIIQ